jgi:hypothetical protein
MPRRDEYSRLENRLILLSWMNDLFGYQRNLDLLQDTVRADEGFDSQGHSGVLRHLESRSDALKIDSDTLARYDGNIRRHLDAMNERRTDKIRLRYFQHLAALYTEVYLDRYFNQHASLLRDLNTFVAARNAAKPAGEPRDEVFSEADLSKLAYWMATGSGKTLIMHLNYRQFLHYNRVPLDNILLITPSEGLSDQHIQQMHLSGIRCERFNPEDSGLALAGGDTVRVLEITKLVDEKKGGGVRVPVERFEGNNLILVDEGHKGTHGPVYRSYRNDLAETGFTFEYSATFGQALEAARADTLTKEYSKAIIFDYSYKYFYGDGFGKDFHVVNLLEKTTEEQADVLLLANLLSFYQQMRLFHDQRMALQPYGIDPPLWVFVGSSVNAVYTEAKMKRSDVLTVARFLHRFLRNKRNWSVQTIQRVLAGQSGINDEGRDLFAGRYDYLQAVGSDAATLYRRILRDAFHASASSGLQLVGIKGVEGELGLRVSGASDYFGLIYIGDTSAFKALVEEDNSGIEQADEAISGTLFDRLKATDSRLNVLIGAKKFIEGWDSWRVSNMGLLNVGRGVGSQIIQLFGRGVRLRGLGLSLKRSTFIPGAVHPANIRLLETLSIFAIRANYMGSFREYLEKEGVETSGCVELPLPIRPNEVFLKKGLLVPRVPQGRNFDAEIGFLLEPEDAAVAYVDVATRVEAVTSGPGGIARQAASAGVEQALPSGLLDLLDWERIYLDLHAYKEEKGYWSIALRHDDPRRIIEHQNPRLYRLSADPAVFAPTTFSSLSQTRDAVTAVLKKYMDRLVRLKRQRWVSDTVEYQLLTSGDANFKHYSISISKYERELIAAVEALIADANTLYNLEVGQLPRIHFDQHLYQPLLVEQGDKVQSSPPALGKSERVFVADLRAYFNEHGSNSLAKCELFLLRNLSRGQGIGFFSDVGFYPDFILWLKTEATQRIVFIEPHGMVHEKAYIHDDKARLHERLPGLSAAMLARAGLRGVELDSFIVSSSRFDELRKRYDDGSWDRAKFASRHIVFQEPCTTEYDYIALIFGTQRKQHGS